jgi:hypothetical protein
MLRHQAEKAADREAIATMIQSKIDDEEIIDSVD